MRFNCTYGYFKFQEDRPGEVALFNSLYDQDLIACGDFYTFEELASAPDYCIKPLSYLDLPSLVTYAGAPSDIFEQNKYVYNFQLGRIVPISSVTNIVQPTKLRDSYTSNGLIMPGSVTKEFKKITGYNGWVDLSRITFYYTEFFYA